MSKRRLTIVLPFLVSVSASLAMLAIWATYDESKETEWQPLTILTLWPIQSLGWSLVIIWLVANVFSVPISSDTSGIGAWRERFGDSFAATASIIVAVTVGATPQLWWMVQMAGSKGFLFVPLGEIMLLQCTMIAWAIAVFTSTVAPGTRIGLTVAYLMFSAAFIGVAVLLRIGARTASLPYLGGNRIDAFSPLTLYLQRFVHDRPVSRLHLMYATSLTMFAVAGALLLFGGFAIALRRSRRA